MGLSELQRKFKDCVAVHKRLCKPAIAGLKKIIYEWNGGIRLFVIKVDIIEWSRTYSTRTFG